MLWGVHLMDPLCNHGARCVSATIVTSSPQTSQSWQTRWLLGSHERRPQGAVFQGGPHSSLLVLRGEVVAQRHDLSTRTPATFGITEVRPQHHMDHQRQRRGTKQIGSEKEGFVERWATPFVAIQRYTP